jgi:HEAT repeats
VSSRRTRAVALLAGAIATLAAGCARPDARAGSASLADSLYRAGRMQLARQEYRAASETLGEVASRHPDAGAAGEAAYWRAVALYELGDRAALDQAFAAIESLGQEPAAPPIGMVRLMASRLCRRLAELDAPAAQRMSACSTNVVQSSRGPCAAGTGGQERAAAIAALIAAESPDAWPALRELISDGTCSPELRRQGLALASEFSFETTLPTVLAVSRDTSERVLTRAISLLAQAPDARAVQRLVQLATDGPKPHIRSRALSALGENGTPEAHAFLRTLADGRAGGAQLQNEAIETIAENLRDERDVAYLRELFARSGLAQQRRILDELGESADAGARRWILSIASNPAHPMELREEAVDALSDDDAGIAELIRYYDRPEAAPLRAELLRIFDSEGGDAGRRKLAAIADDESADPALRLEAARLLRRMLREEIEEEREADEDNAP